MFLDTLSLNFPSGLIRPVIELLDCLEFRLVLLSHNILSDFFLNGCLFGFIFTVDLFVNVIESVPLRIESREILNFLFGLGFGFLDSVWVFNLRIFEGVLKVFLEFAFFLDDEI